MADVGKRRAGYRTGEGNEEKKGQLQHCLPLPLPSMG